MSTAKNEEQPIQKHETLWASTGHIVIQAESTLFRVHADVLANQSEVFRDLLSLPQPENVEAIEGAPLVRIEGTTAEDMCVFLQCLQNPIEYHRTIRNYSRLAILLRMAHKYLASAVQEDVSISLAPMFPSTFQGYVDAEDETRRQCAPFDYTSAECCVAFANMFRETGMLTFLPITLYRLCRLKVEDLFDSGLSLTNLNAVVVGRSRLAAVARSKVFKHAFHDRCEQCDLCPARPLSARCNSEKRRSDLVLHLEWDCWLDPLVETYPCWSLCAACSKVQDDTYNSGREACWERLPELFGLPPWSKLREDGDS